MDGNYKETVSTNQKELAEGGITRKVCLQAMSKSSKATLIYIHDIFVQRNEETSVSKRPRRRKEEIIAVTVVTKETNFCRAIITCNLTGYDI